MTDIGLIEYVQDYGGVFFGSRAWGGFRENSDFNYVMPLTEAVSLRGVLSLRHAEDLEITSHKYYVSGYCIKNIVTNTVINVTGCNKKDFPSWIAASKMMKKAPCDKLTKEARKMLFETILSLLKRTML
jgi:hypothetical protein